MLEGQARRRASAMRRRRVSFPPSRSAVMATAAPASPMTTGLIELLRSLRNHGQGVDKYENVRIGVNSRLDTIQAAILHREAENFRRRDRAARTGGAALFEALGTFQQHSRAARDRRARSRPGRNTRSRCPTATGSPADLKDEGHSDRDLLSDPAERAEAATADYPVGARAGVDRHRQDGDQPADASLSRRSRRRTASSRRCWKASAPGEIGASRQIVTGKMNSWPAFAGDDT